MKFLLTFFLCFTLTSTVVAKPVMLIFGADWCGYCKKLENETISKMDLSDFEVHHIDIDTQSGKGFYKAYDLNGVPSIVVLERVDKTHGKLLGKISGFLTRGELTEWLAPHLRGKNKDDKRTFWSRNSRNTR